MAHIEIARQIRNLSESLLELTSEASLAELIEIVDELDSANRNIRSASMAAKTLANIDMDKSGQQRVVLPNGLVAEKIGSY